MQPDTESPEFVSVASPCPQDDHEASMSITPQLPTLNDLRPIIKVIGVGGAGGNAINNMIASGLKDVDYIVANTDAQALASSGAERRIQLGINLTQGLGAGSRPEIGIAAAEEAKDEITESLKGAHMAFIAAGMGGGTGTGGAAVIARAARDMGLLTVGIVTKPFHFEGARRMRVAEAGIAELKSSVDTLIVIPNQNLFRIANERTTFAEAFVLADKVLHAGVACIVDLIMKDGLINLDFADVQVIMRGMGTAMMGTGEATGEERARKAAEMALANPLIDDLSLGGAKGVLLSIIGGPDMTLFEVDEAASRVREEVDADANIIVGASFDHSMAQTIRIAIVASGMVPKSVAHAPPAPASPVPPPQSARPAEKAPNAAPAQPPVDTGSARGFNPEDLNPRVVHRDDLRQAAPAGARELWRAPGGVVIEESAPMPPGSMSSGSGPQGSMHPGSVPQVSSSNAPAAGAADRGQSGAPPPLRQDGSGQHRGEHRRVPSVDEFPPVAQREYAAKSSIYSGNPSRLQPLPPPVPSDVPERRGGLLQRLVGSRKGGRD
jgi:cell division protein FtsZ